MAGVYFYQRMDVLLVAKNINIFKSRITYFINDNIVPISKSTYMEKKITLIIDLLKQIISEL